MNCKITVLMLLLCFQYWTLSAQERIISGTVTIESDAMPLPGVTVLVKGTQNGTSTDMDGHYSIQANSGDILVFSFVGFITQEIQISQQETLNIALQESMQGLEEVVITALGITRDKKSLGYATQEVEGEAFSLTNQQNVLGSLSGRVAGVQVMGSSGASMGGTQKIKIRGVNSIGGADQPLIVVDGTPISNANFSGSDQADYGNLAQDVNPNNIASVNVLKGPAASALYGIRGQYGVIMITTKKGQKGSDRFTVDLNSSFSMERVGNLMPLQNRYGAGSNQTWSYLDNGDPVVTTLADESWGPRMDGTPVRHYYSFYPQDPQYGQLTPFDPHPDNVKDFFETGTNFSQGVTISGGSENTNLRLS